MKRVVRGVVLLATSSLVVCGVKGPPRPAAQTDAGAAAASSSAPSPAAPAAAADGGPP
ncbi:MAG TPA: hypothetical protein VGH20_02310 [Myxococcales bacterium]